MTQKNKKRQNQSVALLGLFLLLAFSQNPKVLAQSLPLMTAKNIGAETAVGTPVSDIFSAFENGGISTQQNFDELKNLENDGDQISEEAPAQPALAEEDPVPAPLNPDSFKLLESQGGLSSEPEIDSDDPTVFKIAVRFLERVIFRSDTEFAKRPVFDEGMDISGTPTFDKDTAGYAVIQKDNQSVAVEFEEEYETRPIVTASLSLQQYKDKELRAAAEDLLLVSDVKYIVTKVTKKGFEIMMDRKADSDIPFSWHALCVDDPKVFKKEGESLNGGNVAGSESSGSNPEKEDFQNLPDISSPDNFFLTAGDAPAGQAPDNNSQNPN